MKISTDLSIEQCRKILNDNRWKFKNLFSPDKKYFIKNYGNFLYSTVIEGRNSWSIYFFGYLAHKKNHTEIKGIFFIHPFTFIFSIIFIIFILFIYIISAFQNEILYMLIAFILLTSYGLLSARKYPGRIIEFLKTKFKAE